MFILALGVPFAINSNLGISPVNAWPFTWHLIFDITVGTATTIFFSACILFQIILLRKQFKWYNLTQIVFSFLFGVFLDICIFFLGDLSIPTYAGQLAMLLIGIFLIATGLSIYLEAKLVSLPSEGAVQALVQKLPKSNFAKIKVWFDCALISLAIITSFIFLNGLYGIREGTVIAAICVGKTIPLTRKFVIPIIRKTGFYEIK